MDYQYIAYTQDRKLVRGKLSAVNEEAATNILSYGGYQVISLKEVTPLLDIEKLRSRFYRPKSKDVIMFSRQLALLLDSGTDIVTSLELLRSQVADRSFRRVIDQLIADIRGGSSLSAAMRKHPKAFPEVYHRTIAAGEHGGNLSVVLRQMADYMERIATAQKKIKGAMIYPVMLAVVGMVVVGVIVTVVMPSFVSLYSSLGAELPLLTKIVLDLSSWLRDNGLYIMFALLGILLLGYILIRTPSGKYRFDQLMLTLPVIGRINHLNELSRCCRTIALLFKVGLPLPEILAQAIRSTNNKVVAKALTEVQEELIRGEGLSKPMAKRKLFLPLMVQMTGVGEETGNLDATLTTVAQSYEAEADDKTTAAIGLIQPALVVVIAMVVGFIAISLLSTMYSIYGQIKF